ncbi:MAG: glycosyltransferase family 39 protein [Bacteroidia bacterium]
MKRYSSPLIICMLIMVVAVGLRLYRADDFMLGNDEHSALVRLQYDGVGELIEKGIKPDGHPAGVQLFLYGWTNLVGTGTWPIRIPFMLLSLLGLVYAFRLSRLWFGLGVASVVMTVLATSSYVLLNHLSIRPYGAGMCFVLALAFHQEQFRRKDGSWTQAIWMVLFASLCLYTHYFSALQAGLIGLLGLLRTAPSLRKRYVQSWLLVGFLYLPHISIFLTQIQTGGIGGWLSKPSYSLFLDWIQIGLNGWLSVVLLAGIVAAIGVFFRKKIVEHSQPKPWLYVIALAIIPFIFGFIYSHTRNPLLHLNSLFFSFPFLLMALFGWLGTLRSPAGNVVLTILFLLIGTTGLIQDRKHYDLFYNRGTGQLAKELQMAPQEGLASIASVTNPAYLRYHLSDGGAEQDYDRYDPISYTDFRKWASDSSHQHMLWAWAGKPMDLTYAAIAQEYFPTVIHEKWKPTTEILLLGKAGTPENNLYTSRLWLDEEIEYGPSFQAMLSDYINCEHQILHVYTDFRSYSTPDPDLQLVLSLEDVKTGENIAWTSKPLHQFYDSTLAGEWQRAHYIERMRFIQNPPYAGLVLKSYVWNNGKGALEISGTPTVEVWKGNPAVYAFMEWVEPCQELPVMKPTSNKSSAMNAHSAIVNSKSAIRGVYSFFRNKQNAPFPYKTSLNQQKPFCGLSGVEGLSTKNRQIFLPLWLRLHSATSYLAVENGDKDFKASLLLQFFE